MIAATKLTLTQCEDARAAVRARNIKTKLRKKTFYIAARRRLSGPSSAHSQTSLDTRQRLRLSSSRARPDVYAQAARVSECGCLKTNACAIEMMMIDRPRLWCCVHIQMCTAGTFRPGIIIIYINSRIRRRISTVCVTCTYATLRLDATLRGNDLICRVQAKISLTHVCVYVCVLSKIKTHDCTRRNKERKRSNTRRPANAIGTAQTQVAVLFIIAWLGSRR